MVFNLVSHEFEQLLLLVQVVRLVVVLDADDLGHAGGEVHKGVAKVPAVQDLVAAMKPEKMFA